MHHRTTPRLLIVEDCPQQAGELRRLLQDNGFDASSVHSLKAARDVLSREQTDLVLMNLSLKDGSARALLTDYPAHCQRPAFIVVSEVHAMPQQLRALDEGADDYIRKPFHGLDLVARVQAVLRRTFLPGRPSLTHSYLPNESQAAQYLTLNPSRRSLLRREKHATVETVLTEKSFLILQLLITHPYQVLSRQRIAQAYFGRDHVTGSRSIDVEIAKLRKTLGDDCAQPALIRTARGKGYLFTPLAEQAWPQPGQQCLRLAP